MNRIRQNPGIPFDSGMQIAALFGFLLLVGVSNVGAQTAASGRQTAAAHAGIWNFNQVAEIGGHPTQVLGHPHVINSPYGKAVEFNGVDDGIFIPVHPLAGASTFTWEVIFRPDADGAEAQ